MKKTKLLLLPMLLFGLIGLSACSLFNDDDIAIKNEYNPPEDDTGAEPQKDPNGTYIGNVKADESVEEVPNTYVFDSIPYVKNGKIANTYKEGGENENEFNVNGGEDYNGTRVNNNFDLYVPKAELKNSKHVVILFIHGGAWVTGFKMDVNPYVYDFVNKGYIAANIKYTLLKRDMSDANLSIFRNLDEIDACVTSIKESLHELYESKNITLEDAQIQLVIGGASSGAHLAMLYTYSRGQKASLKPQFVIDAVGPTDIKPGAWKKLSGSSDAPASIEKDSGNELAELAIAGEDGKKWNEYQTMRIANGMCGIPYSLEVVRAATDEEEVEIKDASNAAAQAMTKAGGGEDQLSVTYWMKSATVKTPIICAYAGKDTIVGINQFANLQTTMDSYGFSYEFIYFPSCGHTDLKTKTEESAKYNQFITAIDDGCQALLA